MSKSIIKQKRILTKASGGSSLSTPVSVANGGTGISSYAIGDIIYASGATTISKLPIGTASQQLRVNAGATALEYFTPTGSGITVGSTTITSGTTKHFGYNLAGVYQEDLYGLYFDIGNVVISPSHPSQSWATNYNNAALGALSLGASGAGSTPSYCSAFGYKALYDAGSSNHSTAVGTEALVSGSGYWRTALGSTTTGTGNSILLLGYGANSGSSTNVCVIGAAAATSGAGVYNNLYFNGVTYTSAAPIVINACGGSGTNNAGASLTLAGGKGTGSATTGGDIIFQTSDAAASSSTLQTLTTKYTIKKNGVQDYPTTVTAGGTTGNQTINKVSGTVNFAAGATAITVTNSLVSTTSIVFAVVRTDDTTATIKNVVPGSGSFVITLTAATTAETSVGFFTINS